jgi:hypothetical protein
MSGGLPSHRRVYRSIATIRAAIGCSAATIGFCVLAALPGDSRGLGFVLAPLLLIMSYRAWTAGIHVEADGVKVVGFLLSRRFRWDEIDHFEVLPLGRYPYVGHVVLRDGTRVGTYGIGAPARPKSKAEQFRLQVQRPVDELNQVLADRRGTGRNSVSPTAAPSASSTVPPI